MAIAGLAVRRPPVGRPAPSPAALRGMAAAAVAAALVTVAITLTSDHVADRGAHAALVAWVTLTYTLGGLVAWSRWPEGRLGPLMLAAGSANFLSTLSSADRALPYTIGIAFDLLAAPLFLHVFLAFPSGHVPERFGRGLVVTAYACAFGLQLVAMALGGFGEDNLLGVVAAPDASSTLQQVQLVALSACSLAGIGVLVARRRATPATGRRRPALLVDAFALGLVMIAVLFVCGAFGLATGEPAFEVVRRATLFVIGLAPVAFVAGLLHARLARSAVAGLLVELRASPAPEDLRAALARALRDPTLALAFWVPEFGQWADIHGRRLSLEQLGAGRAVTRIERGDTQVAALIHDPALDEQPELLEAVAAAAAFALENARLQAELRARVEELRGSRARIVEAGDAERRRIERDLHDGAQQRMVAVALQLRLVQDRIRRDPAAAEALVASAGAEVAESLRELRELARGLHPAALEHGLGPALEALATRSAVPATVSLRLAGRLPQRVEVAAYFVACEALANVAKYAGATTVAVRAWQEAGRATIEIADDGVGGADDARGSGLRGLADRVEAVDGHLRIASPRGAGTVVTAELPCAS